MRLLSLILSMAAVGLATGQVRAQSLDQDFRTLCVTPKAEMAAALAGADAAGWRALPAGTAPPDIPGGGKLTKYAIRLRADASPRLLVVGEGTAAAADGANSAVKMCFVASPQPDATSVAGEKAALKGEPAYRNEQASMYLVDGVTGQVAPPPAAGDAKAKAVGLATVLVIDTPQATAFAYQISQAAH